MLDEGVPREQVDGSARVPARRRAGCRLRRAAGRAPARARRRRYALGRRPQLPLLSASPLPGGDRRPRAAGHRLPGAQHPPPAARGRLPPGARGGGRPGGADSRHGERARRDLETFGVEVHTGRRVERVAGDHVELSGGERLATATVIWAAGIRAAPVAAWLGLPTGRSGRLEVAPTLQVPGFPAVFAAGDVALVEGAERLPQVAQVAIQQGERAAETVLRARRGEPLLPF